MTSFCIILSGQFDNPTAYKDKVIATGLPASPGAAVGTVVFSAEDAETWHAQGKSVILVKIYPCSSYSLLTFFCFRHNSITELYI